MTQDSRSISSTVTIVRASNGSIGLHFCRPHNATSGPFEVIRLEPNGAAEKSGVVKPGDFFNVVNGHNVSTLDDAEVSKLIRGSPWTPLKLRLCSANTSPLRRAVSPSKVIGVEVQCRAQPSLIKRGEPMPAFFYENGAALAYPLLCGYGCGRLRNPGSRDPAHCQRQQWSPHEDFGCCACRKEHGLPDWEFETCSLCWARMDRAAGVLQLTRDNRYMSSITNLR